jgi:single-strand DNA-binding protein
MLVKLMRITRDTEVRYLPSGEPVANVSLAYSYGTKKDERGYLPSQFIECGLWGKRAESLAEYLTKGKAIVAYVSDVHIETFTKQDGTPGYKLAGRLDNLEFAGGDKQEEPRAKPAGEPAGNAPGDLDDDIPF